MRWRIWRKRFFFVLLCLSLAITLPADRLNAKQIQQRIFDTAAAPYTLDISAWTLNAIGLKLRALIQQPGRGLTPDQAHTLVQQFNSNALRLGQIEGEQQRIASQPSSAENNVTLTKLVAEAQKLRAQQDDIRPSVEATLERQIGAVIGDENLKTNNVLWPPIRFHFIEPPHYLVVSQRQRIGVLDGTPLRGDLSLQEQESLEQTIETDPRYSALVDGIGGYSVWPTMVVDRASLGWILGTVAHEWTHTYLAFKPLGWHFYDSGGMFTINETVASMVGDELGQEAFDRYYREPTPPATPAAPQPAAPAVPRSAPPPRTFDFGAEMRTTRLTVDKLLAEGKVTEAEDYMEMRRQVFVQNGYTLRRLNQAYFAFHGNYATSPGSVDPIGPKLRRLRAQSASLKAFLETASRFTSPADLDHVQILVEVAP